MPIRSIYGKRQTAKRIAAEIESRGRKAKNVLDVGVMKGENAASDIFLKKPSKRAKRFFNPKGKRKLGLRGSSPFL